MKKPSPYFLIEGWLIEYDKKYDLFNGCIFESGSLGEPGAKEIFDLKHYNVNLWSTRIEPHDIIGKTTLYFYKKGVYFRCKVPVVIKCPLYKYGFLDGMRIPRIGYAIKHIRSYPNKERSSKIVKSGQISDIFLFDDDENLEWPYRGSRTLKMQLVGT